VTWEAVGVIGATLVAFAVVVSVLARLVWSRMERLDRERQGDIRLPRGELAGNRSHSWPYAIGGGSDGLADSTETPAGGSRPLSA
jgi:hypothetical protein